MNNVLFCGWTNPSRGREQQAVRVFGEWVELLGTAKSKGTITDFTPVFLNPHGGDLGGFFLITGDPAKLDAWTGTEEFASAMTRAQITVDGMGLVRGMTGEAIGKQMASYNTHVAELTKK